MSGTKTRRSPAASAATAPPVRRRQAPAGAASHEKHVRLAISLAAVLVFLGLWQLAYELGWIDPLSFSAPSLIASATAELIEDGELVNAGMASLGLFLAGLAVSAALAVPLGVLLGWYPRLNAAADPFVSVMYAAPRVALIPLVLIWFGIGFQAELVIVVMGAFFPLLINTMAGVRAIDTDLLRVARSYGARDRTVFRTLALPTAVPYITSGLRHAEAQALIGVVVAEFFVGTGGIGKMITDAGLTLKTDVVFVGIFVVAVAALVFNALLLRVERYFERWRPDPTAR